MVRITRITLYCALHDDQAEKVKVVSLFIHHFDGTPSYLIVRGTYFKTNMNGGESVRLYDVYE